MKKNEPVLLIIDMQNDFITGSLANEDAEKIVPSICELIKEWEGPIICTRDTHGPNYLNTPEGQKLPVEHCIKDTAGWCVNDDIQKALRGKNYCYVDKGTFGFEGWDRYGSTLRKANLYIAGTCTNICVITNALLLKTVYPENQITVLSNLCAGLTPEKHEAALNVMKSCQIDVVNLETEKIIF